MRPRITAPVFLLCLLLVGRAVAQNSASDQIDQLLARLAERTAQADQLSDQTDSAIAAFRAEPSENKFFDVFFPLELRAEALERNFLAIANDAAVVFATALREAIQQRTNPKDSIPIRKEGHQNPLNPNSRYNGNVANQSGNPHHQGRISNS